MADPKADMDKLMNKMEKLQNALDACNGWELERQLEVSYLSFFCRPLLFTILEVIDLFDRFEPVLNFLTAT